MNLIKKKEFQFLFFSLLVLILFINNSEFVWEIFVVPYVKTVDFFDLRYLQYLSTFFNDVFKTSEELYTQKPQMVINYPRIWIILSHYLNLKSDFNLFSIFIITVILYFYVFFYLIKKFNSYIFFYIFFSGSSFLLLERGNVDIFIFVILSYTFISNNNYINYLGYLITSFLKVYPSFSLMYFLNKKRPILTIFILSIIVLIYMYLLKNDAKYIAFNSPKTGHASYGLLSIILNIKEHLNINLNYILFLLGNTILIIITYLIFFRKEFLKLNINYSNFFLLGAGIYIFTFLINTHHDYRLIFITFCIPTILSLENKKIKFLYLFSVIITLELQRLIFFFGLWGGVLNSIFKLLLFYLNCFIYISLIEKFLKNFINKIKKT